MRKNLGAKGKRNPTQETTEGEPSKWQMMHKGHCYKEVSCGSGVLQFRGMLYSITKEFVNLLIYNSCSILLLPSKPSKTLTTQFYNT